MGDEDEVRDGMVCVPAQSSCTALLSLGRPGTPSSAGTLCTAAPCPGNLLAQVTAPAAPFDMAGSRIEPC